MTRLRIASIGWLALLVGCGARGSLESAADVPGKGQIDVDPPPAPCTAWQPAGPAVMVSEPAPDDTSSYFMSMIPSADGALLAWVTQGQDPMSSWKTVAIGFDAAPRSAITSHLSFPTNDGASRITLATNGTSFAGLVGDTSIGCHFLSLDEDGVETAPPVNLQNFYQACAYLAPTPDGFSFLASDYQQSAIFRLASLDAKGNVLSVTTLPQPPFAIASGWLTLHDQSFLLAMTDPEGVATSAQRFSAGGATLADPAEITPGGWYVMPMAETSAGVLAAWGNAAGDQASVYVRLLDEDGRPKAASARVAQGESDSVVRNSALAPTPAGDALLVWSEGDGALRTHALAVGPDGTPRGAPTVLMTSDAPEIQTIVVAPDGRRALLAFSAVVGPLATRVFALPIACVP